MVGEIELSVAVEDCDVTVTLKVTVIVLALPQVRITVADRTLPGCADAKAAAENVTGIVVPKLYAKPDSGVTDGESWPAVVLNVYGIAAPLDMAVMMGAGSVLPMAQERLRVVPSTTLRTALGLEVVRETTISKSP